MTKPYSTDLRERALTRVQAGESVRSVAAALSISALSVVKWSQQFRATGSVAPGRMGGHRPWLIAGEHEAWLRARIRKERKFAEIVDKFLEVLKVTAAYQSRVLTVCVSSTYAKKSALIANTVAENTLSISWKPSSRLRSAPRNG